MEGDSSGAGDDYAVGNWKKSEDPYRKKGKRGHKMRQGNCVVSEGIRNKIFMLLLAILQVLHQHPRRDDNREDVSLPFE